MWKNMASGLLPAPLLLSMVHLIAGVEEIVLYNMHFQVSSSSIGYSAPAIVPNTPSSSAPSSSPPAPFSSQQQVPPLMQPAASPPSPFSNLDPPHDPPPFAEPATPPRFIKSHPPQVSPSFEPVYGRTMPPCGPALPKASKDSSGLRCVAKPNVPAETLQVGMDHACGAGGAECNEIKPYGSCFNPDTVFAHASYAFNSYWQKQKKQGGSCIFGGTAMLINADPSIADLFLGEAGDPGT